jgi:hypothetical protein
MAVFKNNASTTLTAALAASTSPTSMTVADHSMFTNPSPAYNSVYMVTIDSSAGIEIVTAYGFPMPNTIQIYRASEGTSALAHPVGAKVEIRITAGVLNDIQDRMLPVALTTNEGRRVDIFTENNAGLAELRVCGSTNGMQSSGQIFVGQSPTYGGGLDYNGDNSPTTVGAGNDKVTLFRMWNGAKYWTARNSANTNNWEFRGNVTAYASDERLKENIKVIEEPLEKVKKLRGVTYDWKDNVEELGFLPAEKSETGVIAQDVAAVIKDGVKPAPFDDNYLTVQHEKIIPLLIESIKELSAEVDRLKAKLEDKD